MRLPPSLIDAHGHRRLRSILLLSHLERMNRSQKILFPIYTALQVFHLDLLVLTLENASKASSGCHPPCLYRNLQAPEVPFQSRPHITSSAGNPSQTCVLIFPTVNIAALTSLLGSNHPMSGLRYISTMNSRSHQCKYSAFLFNSREKKV